MTFLFKLAFFNQFLQLFIPHFIIKYCFFQVIIINFKVNLILHILLFLVLALLKFFNYFYHLFLFLLKFLLFFITSRDYLILIQQTLFNYSYFIILRLFISAFGDLCIIDFLLKF